MGLAVVVTLVTGADYVIRAVRLRHAAGPAAAGREPPGTGDEAGRLAAAAALIGLLTERRQTMAAAESLTGGLVAAALTERARGVRGLPRRGRRLRAPS